MTERLYYTDSYLTRFEAEVVERADGGRRLYLDRTAFYPTSGGQPCDTGALGEALVLEVVDEGTRIAHLLDRPLTATRVRGEVDWARRFDHMQQHTGQHLLSAVFADLFGWATTSVHFGPEVSTLDLATGAVSPEQAARAEARANAAITENRPVSVGFVEATAAADLRKAPQRSGLLRIVSIAGLDRSACGGTHVRATGEIGAILLRKVERVRKQARVEFLAGARAIRAARADYETLARLGTLCSAHPSELAALVQRLQREVRDAGTTIAALREALARYRLGALLDAAPPGPDGLRRLVYRCDSAEDLRTIAQAVTAESRAILFATLPADPAITVVLATASDSGMDAGAVLKGALATVGGRGGGSARVAQGTVPGEAALRALEKALGFAGG